MLQAETVPCSRPRLNHPTRCADEPCVKLCGLTAPVFHALQVVITDSSGRLHASSDIGVVNDLPLRCAVSPHAGEAVRL